MPSQPDTEHLLRRTEFVARPNRVTELLPLSREAAVDNILAVDTNAGTPGYLMQYPGDGDGDGWNQYVDACAWWIHMMAYRPRPFLEKMVLFWHGHLVSSWWDVDGGFRVMRQLQTYRANALGNFVTLAQQMAIDPAMLVYLSNADNRIYTWWENGTKVYDGDPNQNFARELMELFTLGVGNYTEDDVEAAASAWTGYNAEWKDDPRQSRIYEFSPDNHDDRPKTFFGHTRAWTGPEIIEEILQGRYSGRTDKKMVAARFVAAKLWSFLAYPVAPSAGVVSDVVNSSNFANTMDIRALAYAVLTHNEFYSDTAKRGLVRTPIEFLAAIAYHTGLIPDPSGVGAGTPDRGDVVDPIGVSWRSESTGQQMFAPPNVSGWRPNGYWLNTSALSGRASYAETVAWRLTQDGRHFGEDEAGYNAIRNGTPDAAVTYVANYFGMSTMSTATRNAILATHTADRNSVSWWAWYTVRNLLIMTMLAPEFHMA